MQHLSVIEHYANMLRVDEAERARRDEVEHRFGFAHAAADDLQDFGGCRLASVSFVEFSPKLLDLSAELLLHTAGQNLGRHDGAQCFDCSRKSRDQSMALTLMTLDEARVAPILRDGARARHAWYLFRCLLFPPPHIAQSIGCANGRPGLHTGDNSNIRLGHAQSCIARPPLPSCDHGADALWAEWPVGGMRDRELAKVCGGTHGIPLLKHHS